MNLHAPAAGKANVFSGDEFTVNCKTASITAKDDLDLTGKDVAIVGISSVNVMSPAKVLVKDLEVMVKGGNVPVTIDSDGTVGIFGGVVDVRGLPIKLNS